MVSASFQCSPVTHWCVGKPKNPFGSVILVRTAHSSLAASYTVRAEISCCHLTKPTGSDEP
jgi:hypothetical protein